MDTARDPPDRSALHVRARPPTRCAGCHDALRVPRAAVTCPDCATSLHAECARGLGACPSLGCASTLPRRRRAAFTDVRGPTVFWLLSVLALIAAAPGALAPAPPPRTVYPPPGPYFGPMRCVVFRPSDPPPPPDWRTEWAHRCSCPCSHERVDDPRLTPEHFIGPVPPQVLARARPR